MSTCPTCAGRGYSIGPPDPRGYPTLVRCPDPHQGCLCKGAIDAICELPDGRVGDCPVCGPVIATIRRAEREIRLAGVPDDFRATLPEHLRGVARRNIVERCVAQALADWADPACTAMSGITLLGEVGRGKSEAAAAIVNALVLGRGVTARWCNMEALYSRLRTLMDERDRPDRESESRIIRPLITARVLVLDDLAISTLSPHEQRITYTIADARHGNRRQHLTLATSNRSEAELEKVNGGRIWSRVLGMSSIVTLTGPDHRRKRSHHHTVPAPAATEA